MAEDGPSSDPPPVSIAPGSAFAKLLDTSAGDTASDPELRGADYAQAEALVAAASTLTDNLLSLAPVPAETAISSDLTHAPPAQPEIPPMPQPVAYIAAAAAADAEPPSQTAASGAAPDAAAVQLEVDERFASLRRSYADRLVSMAAVFKELPRRLTEDGPLESLRMCDADPDDLRERAMEIFGEALVSSQEQQIQALQQQLAAKESETARLGRQLGTLITEQREGRDKPSRMLQVAEAELHVARPRLAELEEYHRRAELRSKALEARATTLEEETLHWRARCAPLRDRVLALEEEKGVLLAERKAEREALAAATAARSEAEARAAALRAEADGANAAATEARAQAQRATADSEVRWLRQGLSVVLSRVFDAFPQMSEEVQQGMYSASNGEELTKAGAAFADAVTGRVRELEGSLADTEAALAAANAALVERDEALAKANASALSASEHAHHLVEKTLAAERERHEAAIARAVADETDARKLAEEELRLREEEHARLLEEAERGAARAKAQFEAALDDKGQAFARDMRQLTSAYREARDELASQGAQLREARRLQKEAEHALTAGMEEAARKVDAAEARVRERSFLSAQLAGHASTALQQELLSIFGARELLSSAAAVGMGMGMGAAAGFGSGGAAPAAFGGGVGAGPEALGATPGGGASVPSPTPFNATPATSKSAAEEEDQDGGAGGDAATSGIMGGAIVGGVPAARKPPRRADVMVA